MLVCCGRARRGRLEVRPGGSELAAQPRRNPDQHLDRLIGPLPPLLEARAQRLEHLFGSAQVSTGDVVGMQSEQRREQFVVAQVGAHQLKAPFEVGGGGEALKAFCGRGEKSPLQPQRRLAPVTVWTRCRPVEMREGKAQVGTRLGQRTATPRRRGRLLVGRGRLIESLRLLVVTGDQRPVRLTAHTAEGIGHLGVQPTAHAGGRQLGGDFAQQLVAEPPRWFPEFDNSTFSS